MADEHPGTPDEPPTRVIPPVEPPVAPTSPTGVGSAAGTPAAPPPSAAEAPPIEDIDVPHDGRVAAEAAAAHAAAAGAAAAAAAAAAASAPGPEPAGGPSMRTRTAEGAKAAADRASSAASATVQALRETDVHEIAQNTTSLIENTRPFFLTAFAIAFAFLAAVENHAAIGVVFAIAAVLCVLGAAYSRDIDVLLTGRTERRRRP